MMANAPFDQIDFSLEICFFGNAYLYIISQKEKLVKRRMSGKQKSADGI